MLSSDSNFWLWWHNRKIGSSLKNTRQWLGCEVKNVYFNLLLTGSAVKCLLLVMNRYWKITWSGYVIDNLEKAQCCHNAVNQIWYLINKLKLKTCLKQRNVRITRSIRCVCVSSQEKHRSITNESIIISVALTFIYFVVVIFLGSSIYVSAFVGEKGTKAKGRRCT